MPKSAGRSRARKQLASGRRRAAAAPKPAWRRTMLHRADARSRRTLHASDHANQSFGLIACSCKKAGLSEEKCLCHDRAGRMQIVSYPAKYISTDGSVETHIAHCLRFCRKYGGSILHLNIIAS